MSIRRIRADSLKDIVAATLARYDYAPGRPISEYQESFSLSNEIIGSQGFHGVFRPVQVRRNRGTCRPFAILLWCAIAMTGCGGAGKLDLADRTGGSAALYGQIQAFDGQNGLPLSFADVVRRCRAADVVLFGEEHYVVVCNAYEAQLLSELIDQPRPAALAMEFFERDMQPVLDDYLAGRIEEASFMTQTRQGRSYWLSHRPLIEMCKAAGVPVVAANAPRRLLKQYRESHLPFDEFRATLPPPDQRLLPRASEHIDGPYFERFLEAIKDHPSTNETPTTGPASAPGDAPEPSPPTRDEQIRSFRPMLLWDDTMAESVADFREAYPTHRVMLVVGRFHVAFDGGTRQRLRARRPTDRVCIVIFASRSDARFAPGEDAGAADIVLSGIAPPEKSEETTTAPSGS